MIPITKKECLEEIQEGINTKIFLLCVVSIMGIFIALGKPHIEESSKLLLFIVMILISIIMIFLFILCQRLLIKRIQNNNFFIVEDRLVKIKSYEPKVIKLNPGPVNTFSSLIFQCNGSYKISGTKKETYSKADYLSTASSEVNDKFYLVLYKEKIIKCFNKRYYVIDENEFEFDGGKYLPKGRQGDGSLS